MLHHIPKYLLVRLPHYLIHKYLHLFIYSFPFSLLITSSISISSTQMTSVVSRSTITASSSSFITSTSLTVTMASRPWSNLGAVQMPTPLHPLPKHPERWLPKFNRDDGLPTEENLHNYMLAINLNEVVGEEFVVRLFSYTLTGSPRSWYFSLPVNSITSCNIFEENF